MLKRLPQLISSYGAESVKHCAYELALGPAALVTSQGNPQDFNLEKTSNFSIPPGQFALLLTEEAVTVPPDAIAFISIRASIKFQGLVNVSGFHVDPGYKARLKFSVYNAGSRPVHLTRGDRIFMIWYADLDGKTKDVYKGDAARNNQITSSDRNTMEGEVVSPAQLKKKIDELREGVNHWKGAVILMTGIWITLLTRQGCSSSLPANSPGTTSQNIQTNAGLTPRRMNVAGQLAPQKSSNMVIISPENTAEPLRAIWGSINALSTNQPVKKVEQP